MNENVEPSVPGAEQYPSLALVNSVIALPGGHFVDQLGTPAAANEWLVERGLAPVDAGMREMCAARLRALREQVRSLFDWVHDMSVPPVGVAVPPEEQSQ